MTHRLPPLRRPTRLLLASALVTALAGTALTAAPAGAATWGLTSPVTLAPSGMSVTMAGDNSGAAAAAWLAGGQVWVAEKSPDSAAWSTAVVVSTGTDAVTNPGYSVREPDLDVSAAGHVAVTWTVAGPSTETSVFEAQKDPNGAWTGPRQISNESPVNDHPQVDIGTAGVATVVWLSVTNNKAAVRAKEITTTGSAKSPVLFTSPVDASTNGEAGTYSDLSLARGGNGDVMATWRHIDAGGTTGKVLVARKSGSDWAKTPLTTGAAAYVTAPAVVADGLGHATVAWTGGASAATAVPMVAAWRKGSSLTVGAPITGTTGSDVRLAVNTSGLISATWISTSGLIYAEIRESGTTTTNLTPGVAVASSDVGFSDSGAATVAYNPAGLGQVVVAYRPLGQSFTTATTGAAVNALPLVSSRADSAVIVWSDPAGGAVQTTDLDTSSPASVHMTAPLKPFTVGTSIAAGWIGTSGVGALTYEVSTATAAWNGDLSPYAVWQSTTATTGTLSAKRGTTVCFQVRGIDAIGTATSTSVPRCTTTPLDDRKLKRAKLKGKKVWAKRKESGHFAKTYLETKRRGAVLTLRNVKAAKVALLAPTKRGYGTVKVKIGKKTLGTASLARTGKGLKKQQVVTVGGGGKVRSGTLKIIVTSTNKPVRIDGVYLAK